MLVARTCFLPSKVQDPYQASGTIFFHLLYWLSIRCFGSFALFCASGQSTVCCQNVSVWSVSNAHLRGDARPRRDLSATTCLLLLLLLFVILLHIFSLASHRDYRTALFDPTTTVPLLARYLLTSPTEKPRH